MQFSADYKVENPLVHVPGGIVEIKGEYPLQHLTQISDDMASAGSPIRKIVARNPEDDILLEWMKDVGWHEAAKESAYDSTDRSSRVIDTEGNYGFGFMQAKTERGVYVSFPNEQAFFTVRLPEQAVKELPSRVEARIYTLFRDEEGYWSDEDKVVVDVTDHVLSLSPEEISQLKDNDPSSLVLAEMAGFDASPDTCRVEVVDSVAAYFNHSPEAFGRGVPLTNVTTFYLNQCRSIAGSQEWEHEATLENENRGLSL